MTELEARGLFRQARSRLDAAIAKLAGPLRDEAISDVSSAQEVLECVLEAIA
jgi:hypothetical protein